MSNRKLGKLPVKHDKRTLRFARYLVAAALPPAPATITWSAKASQPWGQMLNDRAGCCTCSSAGHMIQAWTANNGGEVTISDQDVLNAYVALTGQEGMAYDPQTGANDNGATEIDALNYWRTNGIGGHKLGAYAAVSHTSQQELQEAIWLFGGVYIGVALPLAAQQQIDGGQPWDVPLHISFFRRRLWAPGSWGGHAIPLVDYNSADNTFTCITWGGLQKITMDWMTAYCVAPSTRVLTSDLRWVEIGDVKEGDHLLGFDEETKGVGCHRSWQRADVQKIKRIRRPCFDLVFEDGTQVRCSDDHLWLTKTAAGNSRWLATTSLRIGERCSSRVIKPVSVWETEENWRGGYLAAAFDGEGWLSQRDYGKNGNCHVVATGLGFSQKENGMLRNVERSLDELGFPYGEYKDNSGGGCTRIQITKRSDLMRFLGMVRPIRLLNKVDPSLFGKMLGGRRDAVKIVERKFVGEQEVVAMKTSTGTFIAEGLASHNCEEAYALLAPEWVDGTKPAPSGFDMATLVQDLNTITSSAA